MKLNIKCFAMVRDEADIIRDWVRYHLDIFGVGHVHVVDSGSKDGTREILREFEKWIEVRDYKAEQDFRLYKSAGMIELMKPWLKTCDLLVPIDADEFIGLENTCDPETVRREFDGLDVRAHGKFKTTRSLEIVSRQEEYQDPLVDRTEYRIQTYQYRGQDMRKAFFAAKTFQWIDAGNHDGTSSNESVGETPFVLYHHTWRGISQAERKIRTGAESMNYWKDGIDGALHWKKGYDMLLAGTFSEYYQQVACRDAEETNDALARRLVQMREAWKDRHEKPARRTLTQVFQDAVLSRKRTRETDR